MVQPQPKHSPLNELCSALPSLPMRLREVGRFVAANDYDATTRSMRDLAAAAGADPASFTRLAKALGYPGWDALRAALTEARRPAQSAPFSGPERRGGDRVPIPTSCWSPTRSRPKRQALPAFRRTPWQGQPGPCTRRDVSGLPVFEAAAAWRNCSITSFDCSGPMPYSWSAARVLTISTSAHSVPATPLS